LIRRQGILAVLLAVVLVQGYYTLAIRGQVLGDQPEITTSQLLVETNSVRADENLAPLAANDKLATAALDKAQDMLSEGYWAHDAPDGTPPWQWFEQAGYYYVDAGENLARGFDTTKGIVTAWLNSPSHRENVLNANYTEVGFAAVNGEMEGKNTTLVVAFYAKPSTKNVAVLGADVHIGTVEQSESLGGRFMRGLYSATPALTLSLVLLSFVLLVAIFAHVYRNKLPKALKASWYRHHGVYKMGIVAVIAVGTIISYGTGMI
jgi:hypothetical protein